MNLFRSKMVKNCLFLALFFFLANAACKKDETTTAASIVTYKKQSLLYKFVNLSKTDSISRVKIGGDIGYPDKKYRTMNSYDSKSVGINKIEYEQILTNKWDTAIYSGCTHKLFVSIDFNGHSIYCEFKEMPYMKNDTLNLFNWPEDTLKAVYKSK